MQKNFAQNQIALVQSSDLERLSCASRTFSTFIHAALLLGFASAGSSAWAQATTIYANDFESPATTACTGFQGNASESTLSSDYGANFVQFNTADRLCVNSPSAADPAHRYQDPSGTAGNYFVGFHGGAASPQNNINNIESFGLAFDPAGEGYINGTMQLAHVGIRAGLQYSESFYSPNIGSPTQITLAYYRLPVGQTNFTIAAPGAHGGVAVVRSQPSNTVLTPLQTENVSFTNNLGRYELDWYIHTFSVDTSSFAAGDRLVVLFSGVPIGDYIAVDNLIVTANSTPPTPLQVSKNFTTTDITPGDSTQVTIDVQGNNIGDALGLNLTDNLPTPLVLDAVASNTCGGDTSASSASSLVLTDGAVPATGCQIVLEVTWPSSDLCSVDSVTNTIVDGTDFTFTSGATTAGVDATADLACSLAPVATTPVPVGGLWLLLGTVLALLGTAQGLLPRAKTKQ